MNEVKSMTDEELRSHLLTLDYKGKDFKALVLQEIINREVTEAYLHGQYDGQHEELTS